MNRFFSITVIFLIFISCKNNDSKNLKAPRVDRRVELLSIVFRLADSHEYCSNHLPLYVERIDNHFGKYKNHELIKYIKDSIRTSGVAFDAVMKMAINITEPPEMKPITTFTENIPEERWGKEKAKKFLVLLNNFFDDSECELFFRSNEELYKTASNRFLDIHKEIDANWYRNFYGEELNQDFIIVNAIGNGGLNFGVKTKNANNKKIVYAIMGTWMTDSLGLPIYKTEEYFPTLIHEFSHSFVNHNVEKHLDIFSSSGKIIYKYLEDILQKQAYSEWKTMYFEALVRASVIKYLKDHNYHEEYVKKQLSSEINRGFIWTEELVEELDRYNRNRNKYPSFNDFIPEIANYFNNTAKNIEKSIRVVDERRPYIVDITQFDNGDKDVSTLTDEIQINFNKEIKVDNIEKLIKKSKSYKTPEINNLSISNNNKSITIKVSLQSNQNYKIVLKSRCLKTLEGYNPKNLNDIEINFSTN